jgi:hypothetical protein
MDQIYRQIVSFQHRVNDYTDDDTTNISRALKQEVQRLEDEAQVGKNPRSLDDRVKQVIRLLQQAGETASMSPYHADELKDQCEDFRRELQKLF